MWSLAASGTCGLYKSVAVPKGWRLAWGGLRKPAYWHPVRQVATFSMWHAASPPLAPTVVGAGTQHYGAGAADVMYR